MATTLTDAELDAVRDLLSTLTETKAARDAAAAKRATEAAEIAADKARLQPFEDAIQAERVALDTALATIRGSNGWKNAQAAVRTTHDALADAAKKREPTAELAAYNAALAARDALTATAFQDHDAAVAQPLADQAAEIAKIAAEKQVP